MSASDSKRYRAVRRMLKETGNRLFENCHWCGCQIIWWQKLPKESILNAKKDGQIVVHNQVTFQIGGKRQTLPVVTIDHIQELSNGGSNYYKNLVLSCQMCNSKRSNPPKNIYTKCDECGKDKPATRKRLCKKCKEINWLKFSPHAKQHLENNKIGNLGDIMKKL